MADAGKYQVHAWMVDAPIEPDDPLAPYKRRAQQLTNPHYMAGERAARLEEVVGLFADEAFDPGTVWDTARAAGLTDFDLDAASYIVVELEQIERRTG
jgi:hypothetical protein